MGYLWYVSIALAIIQVIVVGLMARNYTKGASFMSLRPAC